MRTLVALLIPLALSTACADPGPAAPTPDEVRAAIEAQNRTFGETFRSGDADALAALYTADGAVLPPNAPKATGPEALAAFWGGVLGSGVANAVLTTEEVSYAGGDTATELGSAVLSLKDGSVADEAKYAVLWKQTPDGWRMHRDIWNSNRAPAPAAAPEAPAPTAAPVDAASAASAATAPTE